MARDITYLTVQDHLWINLQVTKAKNEFNFATLEEAVYYQYGYGKSTDVLAQAARYASGFAKKSPFAAGNEATAFVGLMTFLKANEYNVKLSDADASEFFGALRSAPESAEAKLKSVAHLGHHHHSTPVAELAQSVIEAYPLTLGKLSVGAVSA